MRQAMGLFLTGLLVLLLSAGARADEIPKELPARAYLLMDAATGQVLHEHRGGVRLPIASTTKIMTAILALERGRRSDVVTVGQKPYDTGGSTVYLDIGETQTLENLLYALMLESANDAGVAIAEHLAGTEEEFARWMNDKAREIGALNTHYMNSHGLHHENHYSTAYDLALIARYAMQNKAFRELILVDEKEMPGFKSTPPRKLVNHNRLLGYYEGANGVKNGYTEEAGLTNVASARRGDTELIAVVLGAENQLWTSSMALLDYGFQHFQSHVLVRKGDLVGSASIDGAGPVAAVAATDLTVTLPVGAGLPERRTVWEQALKAPLDTGVRLGQLQAAAGEKVLGTVDLITPSPVQVFKPLQPEPGRQPESWQGFMQGGMLAMTVVFISGLSFLMRRLRQRRQVDLSPGRPHGRKRLYEIRDRRL